MARRYTKKRTNKRRTTRAKRKMIVAPRIGKKIVQPVHYFRRHIDFGTVSTTANQAFTVGTIYIEPGTDIPGWSEFQALYDSYKVNAMKVMFIPISNVSFVAGTGASAAASTIEGTFYYRFASCIDYNDRANPTNLNTIREYDNCKVTSNNKIHKRYFKPNFTLDVENDDFPGTMANRYKPWLNTSAQTVEHFGLKYGFEHVSQASVLQVYRVEIKVYLSFKAKK